VQTDYVQRFLFERLAIRGRLVCLTLAWTRMLEGRGYPARIAETLGHGTALAVLLGAGQKGAGRVTLQAQGSGPLKLLVADCTSELKVRGMAHYAGDAPELGEGRLAVSYEDNASGRIYQSLVPLEGRTMAEVFENYLRRSEQREAFLHLQASDAALCGLLLEKLPGADDRDVERVLRSLGRPEVESILAEKSEVVVRNEMCNHEYRFDRSAIEAILA
jgi:molecular chaperone Hsp33